MRYQELLEYKRDITISNFGEKFMHRMEQDESIADFINDGGLDSEIGKPYEISDELVQEFIDDKLADIERADPSTNKQYVQWMLLRYIDGSIELFEDILSTTSELLTYFHNLKVRRQLPPELMDINKFKSRRDIWKLYDKVHSLWNAYQKKRGEETDTALTAKGDATELYNDANVRVIIPKNQQAACHYGQGTKWCTASTVGTNYFNDYNSRGNLYIFLPKNPKYEGEKYQLHDDGDFLNEKDQLVQGGLKWLLYERFPSKELRDFWVKLDTVVSSQSANVYTPLNGITSLMFGFTGRMRKVNKHVIFIPTNPQHDGEQYRTSGRDGTSYDENEKQVDFKWLIDTRFPDAEIKDKLVNPIVVYTDTDVRVVEPNNMLTMTYYGHQNMAAIKYVFEPTAPIRDSEQYSLLDAGIVRDESNNDIDGGIKWLLDERFQNEDLKNMIIDIDDIYVNEDVTVVKPNNIFSKHYLGDNGQRSLKYHAFIPSDGTETYILDEHGNVMSISDVNGDKQPMSWLFDVKFPDKELKDMFIKMNNNVFENKEVTVNETGNYLAKKYNYNGEYPPTKGEIYTISAKSPQNSLFPDKDNVETVGDEYTVVVGENRIFDTRGHRIYDYTEFFNETFKDPSLMEFISKKITDEHTMEDINEPLPFKQFLEFTPSNVIDDILESVHKFATEQLHEVINELEMDDHYYYDWLHDEGYWDEEEDVPSDDAPSYLDYSDEAQSLMSNMDTIGDITMGNLVDAKDDYLGDEFMRYVVGCRDIPELIGYILTQEMNDDNSIITDVLGKIEGLTLNPHYIDDSGVISRVELKDDDSVLMDKTYG